MQNRHKRVIASAAVTAVAGAVAVAIAPQSGRVNAVLVLVLAIAIVGWIGGLRLALLVAGSEFLLFSLLIAERRLPGEFVPERFFPQLLLFGLVAFAAGIIANRFHEQARALKRGAAEALALRGFTRKLGSASGPEDIVRALRGPEFASLHHELRIFVGAPTLHEILPPERDDAGLAAEAAELVWLTQESPHRIGPVVGVLVENRGTPWGVLVSTNLARANARRLSPALLEALANLIAMRLDNRASESLSGDGHVIRSIPCT